MSRCWKTVCVPASAHLSWTAKNQTGHLLTCTLHGNGRGGSGGLIQEHHGGVRNLLL